MASDPFRLACKFCGWRPATDLTMGVAAQHFETEHDVTEPAFELIVVCDRCDGQMDLFATLDQGNHFEHHYECTPCHRGRRLKQRKEDAAPTGE